MKSLTMATIAEITQGRMVNPEAKDVVIKGIATDTRIDLSGALFVALRGARFDAHDFIEAAERNGAIALLVEREVDSLLPQVIVNDTQLALGHLAGYQRAAYNIPTIALTGSCGKTTTKEMLNSILEQVGVVHATEGNYNNEFGVPFTMFRLEESHDYSVIEMGAAKPGDIHYLTLIVKPDVALITCVAEAHLEGMGSLQGVANTKGEILDGLTETGIRRRFAGRRKQQAAPADQKAQASAATKARSTAGLLYLHVRAGRTAWLDEACGWGRDRP